MPFKKYANFYAMIRETIDSHSNDPAYQWFDPNGKATSISWHKFHGQMKTAAKSLMALGVEKGDKVNILSYTCFPWLLTDLANMSIGGATVGIYQSNLALDCEYIINHSDGVLVFAENQTQLDKLLEIRSRLPHIRKVILFKGEYKADDWVMTFDQFLDLGKQIEDRAFEERARKVTGQDTAGIVYTSGTTGVPKGVVLTHDNITFTCQSVFRCVDYVDCEEMFVFLPLAHVFARTCCYASIHAANRTTFARSIDTLVEDFQLARPHWFVSVPRVFEKIHTRVISEAEAKGGMVLKIFNWALKVGDRVTTLKVEKKPVPSVLKLQYNLAVRLVFSKIQKALGGNVKWCISGAAPLNPEIGRFFYPAGLLILEGLGMTENTSVANVNRPTDFDFGVVGPPVVGTQQKLAEDGEVLYKGPNVMKEYYKMPEETAETFTEDGWLKTGDLGQIDDRDVLKITGRKKDLIITAGGKNIAPSRIEGIIAASKYINQVCVVGDLRKYLTAVVTLDEENIIDFARENRIEYTAFSDLIETSEVNDLVHREIQEKNRGLPSFETVKKAIIVPEFTIENKMITPTFKLKKNIIVEHYEKAIDGLYPPL